MIAAIAMPIYNQLKFICNVFRSGWLGTGYVKFPDRTMEILYSQANGMRQEVGAQNS